MRILILLVASYLTPFEAAAQQRLPPDSSVSLAALVESGLYERAEAVALEQLRQATEDHSAQSIEVARASDELVDVLLRNGKGALSSTRSIADAALEEKLRLPNPSDSEVAVSLTNRARIHSIAAEHGEALKMLQRAVALTEQGVGPNLRLARTLDELGRAFDRAANYDEATRALVRSLTIKETIGDDPREVAYTLQGLTSAYQSKGDYARARSFLDRAVDLQRVDETEHPAAVETWYLLGLQLWFEGDLTASRRAFERCVGLAERSMRTNHPATALALRNLASSVLDLGDPSSAHELQQRALGIAERSLGSDHYEIAAYLNSVARSDMRLGDYPGARKRFERALTIAEARLGPRHDWVATFIYNLAIVDATLGDYAAARRELLRAIGIWESIYGPDHPVIAVAQSDMATALLQQGRAANAVNLLERALEIRERKLGPEHRDVARTLADLAMAVDAIGQPARAQRLADRAVQIFSRMSDPPLPDFADVLKLVGDLQVRRGDSAEARATYERALTIRRTLLGSAHPQVAEIEAGLAVAEAVDGEPIAALQAASEAESIGRDHLRLMLRSLPERESLNYAQNRPRGLDLMLSLVSRVPQSSARALDAVIRSRALVLDEMILRSAGAKQATEDAAGLRARFASAQQRLANLIVRTPDQATEQHAALIETARRESELAERALAERSADFRTERDRALIGYDDVAAALASDDALVSYVIYDRTFFEPASGTRIRAPRREASYFVFALRRDQSPLAMHLGSAAEIDKLVVDWRNDIATEIAPTDSSVPKTQRSLASGAALRRRIWDPLAQSINGAARVFVVADGLLSLAPFAALPSRAGRYLIEDGPNIHYLTTERDLAAPATDASLGSGLLALGGPAFDAPGTKRPSVQANTSVRSISSERLPCGSLQAARFTPLGGTLLEVQGIADLWQANAVGEPTHILIGNAAGEGAFKAAAPGNRVLHLATHGFFLSGTCVEGQLSNTRGVGRIVSATSKRSPIRSEAQIALSGLALAGANSRGQLGHSENDGILTAEEVGSLDLKGVQWAVLSACETGVGQLRAGEGVMGLRRAFQIAGAQTVVMSLWSVEDRATRQWMAALYRSRLSEGMDTAGATRAASLSVLRDRRAKGLSTNPFYWAAFVAAGDWR